MSVTCLGYSLSAPSSPPSVAAGTTTGSLDTSAVYGYKVTYVTAFGETTPSSAGSTSTTSTGSINLSSIPVSTNTNVKSRKVYRTVGGGSSYLLLTTITDNATTTYTDTTADGSLGAAAPTANTAGTIEAIAGNLKLTKPEVVSIEKAITAGAGGSSAAAYQLSAGYSWINTVASANDSVKLPAAYTGIIGLHVKIRNNSATAARVYPFDGQTITTNLVVGAADAPAALAATTTVEYICDSATNWSLF